jgi:hypothetical protein
VCLAFTVWPAAVTLGQSLPNASSPAAVKKLEDSLAKLRDEVTKLQKEIAAGQKQEREAAVKFAQLVAADFLESVMTYRTKDAIHMLAKDLCNALGDEASLNAYVVPFNARQDSPLYGHQWKSWTMKAEGNRSPDFSLNWRSCGLPDAVR